MSAWSLRQKKYKSPFRVILFGFLAVILAGSFLLMLPISSQQGVWTPFEDALFTATSAVCVTGLVVYDTACYWSLFGQGVILALIQIGGLGVVTVAGAFAILSGRKINLAQRSTMQEAIAAPNVGGIVRLTDFILKMTLMIELCAAAMLAIEFCGQFGLVKGCWYALFHAISAFCNAGFDLMGREKAPFSSLTGYVDHSLVQAVILALIVVGGIGFLTWDDIRNHRFHLHKYRMQSKVILSVTGLLIVLPTVYFFLFEFSYAPLKQRIWLSLFQAITPRTAGFNTADLTQMTESGKAIMMVLMLIGGSPGSTAGGMKTTTFAIMLAGALAVFSRQESAQFFGRRVAEQAVRQASAIFMLYLVLFFTGGLVISQVEQLPLLPCLFETASAIGTVGLSLGLTPTLGSLSHFILIALMFFGRVGGMTLIFGTWSNLKNTNAKLPQEWITVG
ncbi:MAG: Trk family potassium uptake protein [Pygmaiobacter massiliensis]|nr:Trk family potassium uptake protein [Pygmaiobacter massiliensis]